jgi:hypothetical protein
MKWLVDSSIQSFTSQLMSDTLINSLAYSCEGLTAFLFPNLKIFGIAQEDPESQVS